MAQVEAQGGPLQVMGLVGAGVMGMGIAQIAAQAGLEVRVFDVRDGGAAQGCAKLGETLARLQERGKLTAEQASAAASRVRPVASLAELAGCDLIVEAIVEDLKAKQSLFAQLEAIVSERCVLASNTSSLSVTAIAAGLQHPERVAGFHFFNPVPVMKVVEVVDGLLTDRAVTDRLLELGQRMGHTAVRAKDTPGFIVNHAGRGFGTEALRLLAEGVCEYHDADRVLREVAGFIIGPFELLDITALDVSHPVMESIYHQYYEEPRYRPNPLTRQMLSAVSRRSMAQRAKTFTAPGSQPMQRSPRIPRSRKRASNVSSSASVMASARGCQVSGTTFCPVSTWNSAWTDGRDKYSTSRQPALRSRSLVNSSASWLAAERLRMDVTAENLATKWNITREQQDALAQIFEYLSGLVAARRKAPKDDLIDAIVHDKPYHEVKRGVEASLVTAIQAGVRSGWAPSLAGLIV